MTCLFSWQSILFCIGFPYPCTLLVLWADLHVVGQSCESLDLRYCWYAMSFDASMSNHILISFTLISSRSTPCTHMTTGAWEQLDCGLSVACVCC